MYVVAEVFYVVFKLFTMCMCLLGCLFSEYFCGQNSQISIGIHVILCGKEYNLLKSVSYLM